MVKSVTANWVKLNPVKLALMVAVWLVAPICTDAAAQTPTYDDIAPLLQRYCLVCHSGEAAPNGLRLDSYANLLRGSERGPVVIAGNAGGSELLKRIRGSSQPRMPLNGPPYLDGNAEALIAAWIDGGLVEGEGISGVVATESPAGAQPTRLPGGELTFGAVSPIFLQRCTKCHRDNGLHGRPPEGLRLGTWEQVVAGGERSVIIPGNPGASELVRKVRGDSRPRMPKDGPPYLSPAEIRLISDWVGDGARDGEGNPAPMPEGQRVRLRGTLTGRWMLGDIPLVVGSWTRIKKSPEAGDYVEVRGTVMADGRIRATRIRRR